MLVVSRSRVVWPALFLALSIGGCADNAESSAEEGKKSPSEKETEAGSPGVKASDDSPSDDSSGSAEPNESTSESPATSASQTDDPSTSPGKDPLPAQGDASTPSGPSDYDVDNPPHEDYPILFVAQVPVAGFTVYSSVFGNHRADVQSAPRGGDLMIRYPDGTLRNLTREAGFGSSGEQQGADAIAVREPCVHWGGDKAVFAMVTGAPTEQYVWEDYTWQLYEVSGLAEGAKASIHVVPNQPKFNNVSPIYASNGKDILFTSDRPRDGEKHHYPQLDEYESAPTVTGIYRLSPDNGELTMLEHAPSGAFSLLYDTFGRVIFTKWDHLQRDQQAIPDYNPITFSDESADADVTTDLTGAEVFPEERETVGNVSGHTFNHFLPWELNEDGTAEETLNHVGRHEFGGAYTEGSFIDDPNLTYYSPEEYRANTFTIRDSGGTLQLAEDPRARGTYAATIAPEFYTAGGGQLVAIDGPPDKPGDKMTMTPITAAEDGHYRDPLPRHNGTWLASYAAEQDEAAVEYGEESVSNYDFRLVELQPEGDVFTAGEPLTSGVTRRVRWWDPDTERIWDGPLWELDAVEVFARPAPAPRKSVIEAPEQAVIDDLGIDVEELRAWLVSEQLALIVMRNVTLRDRADLNQPFNLRVPGGVEAIGSEGKVYDISHLQIFQADAVRGYEGDEGRRLLARPMHDAPFTAADAPQGSVQVGLDGSVAAFVPARRALSWQLVDPAGEAVVRERNWLSFQAGEIRGCPVCHGLNSESQVGGGVPENPPEALRALLEAWSSE